jgi:hypothetical protein
MDQKLEILNSVQYAELVKKTHQNITYHLRRIVKGELSHEVLPGVVKAVKDGGRYKLYVNPYKAKNGKITITKTKRK